MTPDFAESLKGRSVLVTGHTGFKGSWLALWLAKIGARVSGYSLDPPSDPNNFTAARVQEQLTQHFHGDICDREAFSGALRAVQPEIVLHLAAQAIVRTSYRHPVETIRTNVLGTAEVLEAVRLEGKPCIVVVVTSDKCYENPETSQAFRETDPMGGNDTYSASKGACEIVVSSYRRSFFPPESIEKHGVKLATVRAGNVVGGGDWAQDRLVVDIQAALSKGEPVKIRKPRAIRPWQHVLEPLSGYLHLVDRMIRDDGAVWNSAWNFGPEDGDALDVEGVVKRFLAEWGTGQCVDCSSPEDPPEASTLRLDTTKVRDVLGWSPRWRLDETVRKTAAWYKAYHEKPDADMSRHCLRDISDYESTPPIATS